MATSSHQRLRSSLLLAGVAAAVSLAVGVALVGGQNARGTLERLANARGREVATRVATLASSYMRERRHEVDVLARSPLVVAAAREATGDPQLAAFLRDYPQRSDIAELLLTDSRGVGVVASTTRAAQATYRQEVWWQAALRDGVFEGYGPEDASRSGAGIEYAVAVRAPGSGRPLGVLRAGFALDRLGQLLATSDLGDGAYLALLVVWRRGTGPAGGVTEPVRAAGAVASRVAGGDLSVTVVTHRTGSSEVGDLLSSVHSMVVALRRLVGAIRTAADEAAAMAAQISASTQEMSASTEEMAATCQDLTKRAAEQAQLVRAAADDAGRILQIVTTLAAGAEDSVRRNSNLATLARRHKETLDQSTPQLSKLALEAETGAQEAVRVAQASADT